jgi:hypothetical protein
MLPHPGALFFICSASLTIGLPDDCQAATIRVRVIAVLMAVGLGGWTFAARAGPDGGMSDVARTSSNRVDVPAVLATAS